VENIGSQPFLPAFFLDLYFPSFYEVLLGKAWKNGSLKVILGTILQWLLL